MQARAKRRLHHGCRCPTGPDQSATVPGRAHRRQSSAGLFAVCAWAHMHGAETRRLPLMWGCCLRRRRVTKPGGECQHAAGPAGHNCVARARQELGTATAAGTTLRKRCAVELTPMFVFTLIILRSNCCRRARRRRCRPRRLRWRSTCWGLSASTARHSVQDRASHDGSFLPLAAD